MPESLREKISEEIYLCKYVDLDRSMCLELADKILFLFPQSTGEVGYFMPMKLKEELAEKDKRIAELEVMCGKTKLEWIHEKDVRIRELEEKIALIEKVNTKLVSDAFNYKCRADRYEKALKKIASMKAGDWNDPCIDIATNALKNRSVER